MPTMVSVAQDGDDQPPSDAFGAGDERQDGEAEDLPMPRRRGFAGVDISRLGFRGTADEIRHLPFNRIGDQMFEAAGFARLATQFRDIARSTAFAQLKMLDRWTPSAFLTPQLTETLRFSEVFAANSPLTAWRSALLAQNHIGSLLDKSWGSLFAQQMIQPFLLDISALSDTAVRLSERVASIARTDELTAGTALTLWQREVTHLEKDRVSVAALHSAGAGGHGVLGLLATNVLSESREEGMTGLLAVVDAEVVEPWTLGRIGWQDQMFEAVGRMDPQVPDLLRGAWDDVHRKGPAAVSKISNCIVEAVDRSLRAAAPDAEVRTWFDQTNLPATYWDSDRKRPTRNLRIRFLLRESHGDDVQLAETHCELVVELARSLVNATQSTKHTGDAALGRVRSLLVTAEALLSILFCGEDV